MTPFVKIGLEPRMSANLSIERVFDISYKIYRDETRLNQKDTHINLTIWVTHSMSS
jgi:hypothetical protein